MALSVYVFGLLGRSTMTDATVDGEDVDAHTRDPAGDPLSQTKHKYHMEPYHIPTLMPLLDNHY